MGTIMQLLAEQWRTDAGVARIRARAGIPALEAHLRRLRALEAQLQADLREAVAATKASPDDRETLRRYVEAAGQVADNLSAQERTEQAIIAVRLAQADRGPGGGSGRGTTRPPSAPAED